MWAWLGKWVAGEFIKVEIEKLKGELSEKLKEDAKNLVKEVVEDYMKSIAQGGKN